MTKEETDLEIHYRLLARSRATKAKKLKEAKRDAEERGKQAFELTILEQHYDTSIEGWMPERADRERERRFEREESSLPDEPVASEPPAAGMPAEEPQTE